MNQDAAPAALSLTGLLNILYRGRRLVLLAVAVGLVAGLGYSFLVSPLYRATAQVRPGIVSYSDQGAPIREWALKDIVRWFRTFLYWEDLRQLEPFAQRKGPPPILADYIPEGPQYQQGGDVITLTCLDADPLQAVAILRTAIASFNSQASQDSLGSTMHLTRGGARVRMEKIRNDIAQMEAARERTRLDIAARERALQLLAADDRRLALKIDKLTSERAWRDSAVVTVVADAAAARARLVEAQDLLQRVMAAEGGDAAAPRGGDTPSDVLLEVMRREQAGRVGDLLDTVDRLSGRLAAGEVAADSLRHRVRAIDLEIAGLRLEREVDLAKEQADIRQEIADLELVLARDLPHQQAQFAADLEGERVRVDLLTPLEQIGRITVTDRPVRPRKLRATAILTGLGLASGMFLVLFREYYRRNREALLAAGD
ncbi:MAG: Wzz/FepE/Etk N-terminal domain-containing protein [Candidatus Krumholzibacteriia bacterium]